MIPQTLFLSGFFAFAVALLVPLPFLRRPDTKARRVSLWLHLLASALFLCLSLVVLVSDQPLSLRLYQLTPWTEFSFNIDRLAAFFVFLISVVSVSAGIYSLKYEHGDSNFRKGLLASLMSLFVLSMLLVVTSRNTFSLLFFWETMSLSSFFMVMFDYEQKLTQKSGLFYFVMTQMSTVLLLFAFILMYNASGNFDIGAVGGISAGFKAILFLCLFIGFGIKAGVMPFHKWLPYAHSASPSNISALMSGVMIKVAVYGMLRFVLFSLQPQLWWGIVVLVFGSVSALLGVIYALKEHDLKKLLAYHSIENIGIILLGIGLFIIFQSYNLPQLALLALAGGMFHTLNHALFKSLLFLTAGSVVHATETRNIEEMGGLIKRMPATGVLFLIGAVSISALPPFNGFVSELMIFQAFFQSYQIGEPIVEVLLFIALSMFALTSALAAACFVKAFGTVFLAHPRSSEAKEAREVPLPMLIGPSILAFLCMALGIFSFQLFSLAGYDLPVPDLLPVGILMVAFVGGTLLVLSLASPRQARVTETWGCGLTSQNSKMEYTASGFSEPILTIFKPIYRTTKLSQKRFYDAGKAIFRSGIAEIKTFKLFEERIYSPLARFVQRLSGGIAALQDVDLDAHIMYAFVTIVILLIVAWWVL